MQMEGIREPQNVQNTKKLAASVELLPNDRGYILWESEKRTS